MYHALMCALHLVSNRLPVTAYRADGKLAFKPSMGGLATGLKSFHKEDDCQWIGWPGLVSEDLSAEDKAVLEDRLREESCLPVYLSGREFTEFYEGFCNGTIWPLFHYFQHLAVYKEELWRSYIKVNRKFLDMVLPHVGEEDEVWVHDYQLMLLPEMIRAERPSARIGFFLHIPYPSFEVFRLLPWREEIARGLLGADLIGFHTYEYIHHFFSSVRRLVGSEQSMSRIMYGDRIVQVDVFPMGIDYEKFAASPQLPAVRKKVAEMKGTVKDSKVILSIDRLDYTKGLPERLLAYDTFLRKYPEYREKVVMLLIEVPTRTGVESYSELKSRVDELVGLINGGHSTIGWSPIRYICEFQDFETLCALYRIADVALITPLRDGMNLIAKEYVAVNSDSAGVLILSETAGAVHEMGRSLVVNPNNYEETADAIHEALTMREDDQRKGIRAMVQRLERYTVQKWASDFMEALRSVGDERAVLRQRILSAETESGIIARYRMAKQRLIVLDYDGTLMPFSDDPRNAIPDSDLVAIAGGLAEDESNCVFVLSGRDREFLEKCFEGLPVGLSAEHGVWTKHSGSEWEISESATMDWKDEIRPVIESYVDRTPGSLLEEKEYALVWHYRRANPELAAQRLAMLREDLLGLSANLNLGVMEGNKVVEVKNAGTNKGVVVTSLLNHGEWDFVLVMGDDVTDEDMFQAVADSEDAVSIKVGLGISLARFNVDGVSEARRFLGDLVQSVNS